MMGKKRKSLKSTGTSKKRKQVIENKKTAERDWEGLPDHVIELVTERLPLADCLSFSNVCKLYRGITTKLFDGGSHGIPLFVLFGHEGKNNNTRMCLNVLDKNQSVSLDISIPDNLGSYIWGSYRDWLVLVRHSFGYLHITLLNPFSGEKVVLPKAVKMYHMVVVSSVPSDARCIYMLVSRYSGVVFCGSGAQQWFGTWNMQNHSIIDALFYEGNFYALTSDYRIYIIEEKSVADMLNSGNRFGISGLIIQNLKLDFPVGDISRDNRLHLVESCGDILLTLRNFYEHGPYMHETHGFQTYRMDVFQMAWVKLENLGDHIIFLGKSCSRSFHAKELGDDSLANKIYFCNDGYPDSNWIQNTWEPFWNSMTRHDNDDEWGVFSLQKENTRPLALSPKAKYSAGIWITAPMWWCLRQTLKHS